MLKGEVGVRGRGRSGSAQKFRVALAMSALGVMFLAFLLPVFNHVTLRQQDEQGLVEEYDVYVPFTGAEPIFVYLGLGSLFCGGWSALEGFKAKRMEEEPQDGSVPSAIS